MYKKFVKRILDFILALIMSIILSPVFIIVAILIKLDSKGPVMFLQERTGKNGKPFKIYKFRTMKVETEKDGVLLTHEQRMTKMGNIIRKLSIDEIPQFFNILKGEMSFIGPRPCITEYYNNFTEEQKKRVSVLPGLTGLAQSKGRNAISIFDKIAYDIEYTENLTFILDLKIIYYTIKTVFTKHGAEITQEDIKTEIECLKNQFKREEGK